jgi:hypothetical protein
MLRSRSGVRQLVNDLIVTPKTFPKKYFVFEARNQNTLFPDLTNFRRPSPCYQCNKNQSLQRELPSTGYVTKTLRSRGGFPSGLLQQV